MQAAVFRKTGDASVLEFVEHEPMPTPNDQQLLIKVIAAGVNFVDVYVRNGLYPSKTQILGREAAGIVQEDRLGFKKGDSVVFFSASSSGTYAQYAVVNAADLVLIPSGLDMKIAAALPVQGMTAHYLVYSTYQVKKGDTVLVHAGAGGTGRLIIALANHIGARVITTVSSAEKAKIAKDAGAHEVINYTECKFEEEVARITQGKGVDVAYDSVGKSTWEGSLASLKKRGMLVLFGNASGPVPPIDPLRLSRGGSVYVTRPTLADYTLTREELEWRMSDLIKAYSAGYLPVNVCAEYPLKDAASAHNLLESRGTTGKIILTP